MSKVAPSMDCLPSLIPPHDKLVLEDLTLLAKLMQLPRPLVFTNGVFDIQHRGHVSYLHRARQLGDSLLVAVNNDASVRQLGKGNDRSINGEFDRAYLLAAVTSTTVVTLVTEKTPMRLISMV